MEIQSKYIDKSKKKPKTEVKTIIPTTTDSLNVEDLKSNIPNRSAIVKKGSSTVQHINLLNVREWSVSGRTLIISTVDNSTPIVLNFNTNDQASQAELRFTEIKNGGIYV